MSDSPAETGLSTAGTVVVVLLLCAQLPTLWSVIRGRVDVKTVSVVPTVGQGANFIAWTTYGLVSNNPAIFRVNAIGCGFFALYSAFFVAYARGAQLRRVLQTLGGALSLLAVLFGGILGGIASADAQAYALGWLALLCNIVMYAAPLTQIRMALKTMAPEAIPLLLTAAGTACSVLWGVYGFLESNWFVLGPNAAGVCLSVLQIAIAAYIIVAVRGNPALRSNPSTVATAAAATKAAASSTAAAAAAAGSASATAAGQAAASASAVSSGGAVLATSHMTGAVSSGSLIALMPDRSAASSPAGLTRFPASTGSLDALVSSSGSLTSLVREELETDSHVHVSVSPLPAITEEEGVVAI